MRNMAAKNGCLSFLHDQKAVSESACAEQAERAFLLAECGRDDVFLLAIIHTLGIQFPLGFFGRYEQELHAPEFCGPFCQYLALSAAG